MPLIVYHIPYRTGQPLDADALRALGSLAGVAGVKYAAGGIDAETVALLGRLPDGFAVLAGDDAYAVPDAGARRLGGGARLGPSGDGALRGARGGLAGR
nr:dihydrodipicolinate synthase family protein [Streptomyces sp. C]